MSDIMEKVFRLAYERIESIWSQISAQPTLGGYQIDRKLLQSILCILVLLLSREGHWEEVFRDEERNGEPTIVNLKNIPNVFRFYW